MSPPGDKRAGVASEFCDGRIRLVTTKTLESENAGVAELVYAPVLGTGPARDGGSSPLPSTHSIYVVRSVQAKKLYFAAFFSLTEAILL